MRTDAEKIEQIEKSMASPPCNDFPMEYWGGTLVIVFPEDCCLMKVNDPKHSPELRKAIALCYLSYKSPNHAHYTTAQEIAHA